MSVGHLGIKAARPLVVGEVHIHLALAVRAELLGIMNADSASAGVRVNVDDTVRLYSEPFFGSPTHLLSEYFEIASSPVCNVNSHKTSSFGMRRLRTILIIARLT